MDNRSGEFLSGAIAFAVSMSALTSPPESKVFQVLQKADAMPEWALIAAFCGLFCMIASVYRNCRSQAMARMMSGSVWGSLVLLFGAEGKLFPLFWIALVLFLFDIYSVTIKGQSWMRRSKS
jgi:hypothetical protein